MANKAQIKAWTGPSGDHWVKEHELFQRGLALFGAEGLRQAAPQPGEAVLDVGCGIGRTTQALGKAVGPGGCVVGVDISTPQLKHAEGERVALGDAGKHIAYREGDAQTDGELKAQAAGGNGFDLMFSQFGVMFFEDPTAAFTNIRKALKPNGRVCFICWQEPKLNPFFTILNEAGREVTKENPQVSSGASAAPKAGAAAVKAGKEKPGYEPGPMSFRDTKFTTEMLEKAGFEGVRMDPFSSFFDFGTDLEHATRFNAVPRVVQGTVYPTLEKAGLLDQLFEKVRNRLRGWTDKNGQILCPAAAWIVSAKVSAGASKL